MTFQEGCILGLHHNPLRNNWADMCGVSHNLVVVTETSNIYIWSCGSRGSASHCREEYKKADYKGVGGPYED